MSCCFTWMESTIPPESILLAILTVSPHTSYCGFCAPTTPAITGPWLIPVSNKARYSHQLVVLPHNVIQLIVMLSPRLADCGKVGLVRGDNTRSYLSC